MLCEQYDEYNMSKKEKFPTSAACLSHRVIFLNKCVPHFPFIVQITEFLYSDC